MQTGGDSRRAQLPYSATHFDPSPIRRHTPYVPLQPTYASHGPASPTRSAGPAGRGNLSLSGHGKPKLKTRHSGVAPEVSPRVRTSPHFFWTGPGIPVNSMSCFTMGGARLPSIVKTQFFYCKDNLQTLMTKFKIYTLALHVQRIMYVADYVFLALRKKLSFQPKKV